MIPLWAHHLLSTLSFLLTLAFVSSILRSRRAAGSTVAWLFVICLIPYVGIPMYLFFSTRKFTTRLRKKTKIYHSASPGESAEVALSLPPIQRILHASGVPEAKPNRQIALLPSGVDAYNKLMELIRGARQSIHLTTFVFRNDPVGAAVVEALAERAAAGLDVRVLVDSLGATMIRHPSFNQLTRAGGKIAYFMPILHVPLQGRTNLRNHRKLLVVDGKTAVLGGMNIAQEYLGPTELPDRWVDLALHLEGGCVNDLQEIFLQDWAYANRGRDSEGRDSYERGPQGDSFLAQVVASGPDVAGDPLYDVLLSAINEAKTSVWVVTPYFIPDESLAKALELAAKRGVGVHIVIPKKSNHRLADLARGSFVRQLESGIEFGLFPRMIHAKVVLIDEKFAILGSANFDMRSLLLNFELGLAVYSKEVVVAVEQWIREKHRETTHDFAKANFWRDLAEGIGRVIGPIL
ncbi:MAG: cardiolipin synthase [Bdellovibrio sp.]|nr:MAG: cardiolipin synthase [Bdellovibrio sp.]